MDTITKYLSIGLGAICALLIIYCLLLRNDRDNALNKIESLNVQLDTVINANCTLTEANNSLEITKRLNLCADQIDSLKGWQDGQ